MNLIIKIKAFIYYKLVFDSKVCRLDFSDELFTVAKVYHEVFKETYQIYLTPFGTLYHEKIIL